MNSDSGSGRAAESSVPADVDRDVPPLSRWQKFRLVVKVVELRLRFIALMAGTGLVFAYWDTLWNRYDKWMRPAAHEHAAVSGIEYYCPMHPQVVQDEHGQLPDLRHAAGQAEEGGEGDVARRGSPPAWNWRPYRVAQAGIRTAEVGYSPLIETVTTVGYVAFDERRMANIVSKVPGKSRVEKLSINFTGQDVEVGQTAGRTLQPRVEPGDPGVAQRVRRGRSSRSRCRPPWPARSWPIVGRCPARRPRSSSDGGSRRPRSTRSSRSGKTDFTIPILSPISGHVFKKNVVEGQEVQEG